MTMSPAPGDQPKLTFVDGFAPAQPAQPGKSAPRGSSKAISALALIATAAALYAGVGGPLHFVDLNPAVRHLALYTAAGSALVLLINILIGKLRAARTTSDWPASGQIAVTIGAFVCTGVGVNTAWGFTQTHLGITDTFTRVALCGTGEIVLIALGLAARDNYRRDAAAGMPGLLVWLITGFLAVPAFAEGAAMAHGFWAGLVAGAWRAVFGPVGAAILWHFAMGLEIRAADSTARSMGVLARLGRRIGQKVLASFGIADTDTTTTDLLRERARVKAANLTDRYNALSAKRQDGTYGRWIRRRLRAALRAANVAHDVNQKTALLADLAISSHAPTLASLQYDNPWGLPTNGRQNGSGDGANGSGDDRQDAANPTDNNGGAGGSANANGRQNGSGDGANDTDNGRQNTPPPGDSDTAKKTANNAAKKRPASGGGRQNGSGGGAKKTPTGAKTRRSMSEWVELAGPVFHAEFQRLRRQPTGEEFATAIANADLGTVGASTAKNIRTAILDDAAKTVTAN